ncbi:Transcription elongation factor, mitochondrial [Frankliniella fusca]|uniref:Transcription elongation factor, mitochondrial n=1 Tax=Frankliniella fusca TaxID=407009 RepID=A0AAE1L808_9NEOP|nr:Transcription elongation factor, mitochondrial [Frankliniella fusca]
MFSQVTTICLRSAQFVKKSHFSVLKRLKLCDNKNELNLDYLTRCLSVTKPMALRALFPEDDQKKIVSYINEVLVDNERPKRSPIPVNIFRAYSEKGPLQNINDLMERYNLSASTAVKLCHTILKKADKPNQYLDDESPKKIVPRAGRKLKGLEKSIRPAIEDPLSIRKFTAISVSEEDISFVVLGSRESDWKSQNLMDWNVIPANNLPLSTCITNIWNSIPSNDVFVAFNMPSRGKLATSQLRLYGAVICALCGKFNYEDVNQKIFEVAGTAPLRHFNLIVGNELISPMNMLANVVEGRKESTADDHVYRRSLSELSFEGNTRSKFIECDDIMKESISHCLAVGKSFVELLKAYHAQ